MTVGALPITMAPAAGGKSVATEFGWATPFSCATKTPRSTVPTSAFNLSTFVGKANFTPTLVTFTVGGTTVVPAGTTSMRVLVVGGGGAGGRCTTTTNTVGNSGGGGGGQVKDQSMTFVAGQTVTVVIGTGGVSGVNPATSPGTASTVSSAAGGTISAAGGLNAPNITGGPDPGSSGSGGTSGSGLAGGQADGGNDNFCQGGGSSDFGAVTYMGPEALNGTNVTIGGTTYTQLGKGSAYTSYAANTGCGGNGVSRGFSNGFTDGGSGKTGFVAIYFS